MDEKTRTVTGLAGALIVKREPAARHVTPEVVKVLKDGGASRDLVDFAERHVDKPAGSSR